MSHILAFVSDMIPYMLITLPAIVAIRFGMHCSRKKKGMQSNPVHEAGVVLFFVFLIGLASQAVIPQLEFGPDGIGIVGDTASIRINWIPFNVLVETWRSVFIHGYFSYLLIEFLGNIGMFAVIGFMLPLLWRKYEMLKYTLITCFFLSLFIEVTQLLLPRATDIDDLITNTLGSLLGFLIYSLVRRVFPGISSKFKPFRTSLKADLMKLVDS